MFGRSMCDTMSLWLQLATGFQAPDLVFIDGEHDFQQLAIELAPMWSKTLINPAPPGLGLSETSKLRIALYPFNIWWILFLQPLGMMLHCRFAGRKRCISEVLPSRCAIVGPTLAERWRHRRWKLAGVRCGLWRDKEDFKIDLFRVV